MKRIIGITTAVLGVMFVWCSYAAENNKFTVLGEWIVQEPGTPAEHQQMMDNMQTTVVITRLSADEDSSVNNVLATGSFEDGKVFLDGEIAEPTDVLISVTRGSDEPMTLPAVLIPGATTSFALWDKENSFPGVVDQLILVEDFRVAQQSNDKFTITGDLSSMTDQELSLATATIEGVSGNLKVGSVLPNQSNAVLLRNGRFSIEGIVSEPILVNLWIIDEVDVYIASVDLVVESGARIEISPSTTSSSFAPGMFASELLAHSEVKGSMHGKIIESWQNSAEYRESLDEYASAIAFEAQNAESDLEKEEEQTETEDSDQESTKDPYDVYQEMSAIQNSVLKSIAQNLDEPLTALLAMELGVRTSMANSRELESWNKLAQELDEDLVARRVSPQRDKLERQIRVTTNASTIVAGHAAPDFTLLNLEGEDIALYDDVLNNNDVVLIDFWASWCGPCIEKIPKLKEFHTEYKDKGFEVVFVSIDDTYEDWKTGSDGHKVPGINVADLNGFLGETPVDYGVQWIPTEFLLKSDGEILDRDLTMEELQEFLVDRFGGQKEEETDDQINEDDVL